MIHLYYRSKMIVHSNLMQLMFYSQWIKMWLIIFVLFLFSMLKTPIMARHLYLKLSSPTLNLFPTPMKLLGYVGSFLGRVKFSYIRVSLHKKCNDPQINKSVLSMFHTESLIWSLP